MWKKWCLNRTNNGKNYKIIKPKIHSQYQTHNRLYKLIVGLILVTNFGFLPLWFCDFSHFCSCLNIISTYIITTIILHMKLSFPINIQLFTEHVLLAWAAYSSPDYNVICCNMDIKMCDLFYVSSYLLMFDELPDFHMAMPSCSRLSPSSFCACVCVCVCACVCVYQKNPLDPCYNSYYISVLLAW